METATKTYDHRFLILDRFLEVKRKRAHFSLRSYASKLGTSPSALSEILSGKRVLTKNMALRIANRLQLTPDETKRLIKSSFLSKFHAYFTGNEELNSIADSTFVTLDLETFKVVSDWYHLAILSMAEISDNSADPLWISDRLGISKSEADGALTRLIALGLIKKKGNLLVSIGKPVSIETEGYEPAIRSFLHQNLDKAHDSLDNDPAELREICAATVAINSDNIPKARVAIKKFRRELMRMLGNGTKNRVFTFGFQLFPVDKEIGVRK